MIHHFERDIFIQKRLFTIYKRIRLRILFSLVLKIHMKKLCVCITCTWICGLHYIFIYTLTHHGFRFSLRNTEDFVRRSHWTKPSDFCLSLQRSFFVPLSGCDSIEASSAQVPIPGTPRIAIQVPAWNIFTLWRWCGCTEASAFIRQRGSKSHYLETQSFGLWVSGDIYLASLIWW